MQAIAAMSENRVIGLNGGIPWRIKEDFQWFKSFTLGKAIIIGRKTFDTLPPLKDRGIFVLARDNNPNLWRKTGRIIENPFGALGSFISVDDIPLDGIVAGGAQIYELLLPHCEELYLTLVKGQFEGDTYMPPFEHLFPYQCLVRAHEKFSIVRYFKTLNPAFPENNC